MAHITASSRRYSERTPNHVRTISSSHHYVATIVP
jgi:hypothetical protein